MIDPLTPQDSEGEVVYAVRPHDKPDLPLVGGLLEFPKVLYKPEPGFPTSVRAGRFSATAVVFLIVDAKGQPIDILVSRKIDPEMAQLAREAVSHYRFAPAKLDGVPVAMRLQIEVAWQRT